jgi:hypothetical protein
VTCIQAGRARSPLLKSHHHGPRARDGNSAGHEAAASRLWANSTIDSILLFSSVNAGARRINRFAATLVFCGRGAHLITCGNDMDDILNQEHKHRCD